MWQAARGMEIVFGIFLATVGRGLLCRGTCLRGWKRPGGLLGGTGARQGQVREQGRRPSPTSCRFSDFPAHRV